MNTFSIFPTVDWDALLRFINQVLYVMLLLLTELYIPLFEYFAGRPIQLFIVLEVLRSCLIAFIISALGINSKRIYKAVATCIDYILNNIF